MGKVALMEFEGNPSIGIFMFANDRFCLIGKEVDLKKKEEISKILGVPIYRVSVLGTDLLGIFLAGDNDFLFTPELPLEEFESISKICLEHGVKLVQVKDKLNTLGNNMSVGLGRILLSLQYPKTLAKKLGTETGYEVLQIKMDGFSSVGAVCPFISGKLFLSQNLSEKEVSKLESFAVGMGSVNSGSPYVASGIVGNKNGVLIGSMSSTVEIQNIVESLNYL